MIKERKCYMEENYFTLTSYLHESKIITYAMEDYLEMIYRENLSKHNLTITKLSTLLNIKKPSCSKMISKLKNSNLVYLKNNYLYLTPKGLSLGKYLYNRHNILMTFLKKLNKENFKLEQVEKIEHFLDDITLQNISKLNEKL